ncbi:MAG TPA: hypothetical protein VGH28_28925 [Polyangiaceae bacterium]
MVRYKTSSKENADTNAALVRAVFEELRARAPRDFQYACYRMEDGVSFVHVATHEGSAEALSSLPAFQAFQKELKGRCAEMPAFSELTTVGSYAPK